MAPENPPVIIIFDSRLEGNLLKGTLQYIEPSVLGQTLRVRWSVEKTPEDFRAIGDGVAYVYEKGVPIIEFPISDDASPTPLGDMRYQWTEGLQSDTPHLMFILILPEKMTLVAPDPMPVGTKIIKGRLAIYWIPLSNQANRVNVEWTIRYLEKPVEEELIHINNEYISENKRYKLLVVGNEEDLLERKRKRELIESHKRRLQFLENQAATEGISVDPKIPIEIEDIKNKIIDLERQIR